MNRSRHNRESKSGQAIIFMMVVIVIGLFIVLWNYDLHNTISTKIRVGNAGDAAALAAARWQGVTMNMVGELNLIQAAVLLEDPLVQENVDTAHELGELRSRISLNGPLLGFVAAQAAGFMNLKEKDQDRIGQDYNSALSDRADEFMASSGGLYRGRVEGAYDTAWAEYGGLLKTISQGDMLVGSANTKYYLFYDGSHVLLNPYFYHAVVSSYWCWFAGDQRDLLADYTDYGYWPALPPIEVRPPVNSEYFSGDMKTVDTGYDNFLSSEISRSGRSVRDHLDSSITNSNPSYGQQFVEYFQTERNLAENSAAQDGMWNGNLDIMLSTGMLESVSWHFYNEESWMEMGRWNQHQELFRDGITVKPEFNYLGGADAAVNVYLQPFNITPGMHLDYDDIKWFAAAKPFGWLDVDDGEQARQMPQYFGLVLPAFRQARLIRNDISSRPRGGTEPGWDDHIYDHVPEYLGQGLEAIEENSCYYCQQLIRWENPALREAGDLWLQEYHENPETRDHCVDPRGHFDTGGGSDWR